jgi:hypothetical protein
VVEVQMRVDDDADRGEVELLRAQRKQTRIEVGHHRVQLRHAGVDKSDDGQPDAGLRQRAAMFPERFRLTARLVEAVD